MDTLKNLPDYTHNKPKAIFFDIDGTLRSFDKQAISPATIEALNALKNQGIKAVVSTGRSPAAVEFINEYFRFDAYVTSNGQYCYCGDEVIHQKYFSKSEISELIALLHDMPFPCLFVGKDTSFINYIDDTVHAHCALTGRPLPKVGVYEQALEMDVYQFVGYVGQDIEKIIKQKLSFINATRSLPVAIDVLPPGGGKTPGIAAVMDYYGITPDQCLAFGDADNDMDMIEYVGFGVAMGNANERLKQIADYVTDSVDDDGVSNALKKLGII